MKPLEDKIKDRLEGYESSLPEGDLAEFRTLLEKATGAGTKRKAAYLAWLAPAAVAAGLAMFFILRPTPGIEPIQIVDNGAIVAQAVDPAIVDDSADVFTVESRPSSAQKLQNYYGKTVNREASREYADNVNRTEESFEEATTPPNAKDTDSKTVSGTSTNTGGTSPFVPTTIRDNKKTASMKVGPAAAGVLGGSGAIALASLLPSMLNSNVAPNTSPTISYVGPGSPAKDPESDEKTGDNIHYMPLRAGLSLRVPFNDKWSLTTGVDYFLYSSSIGYSISGAHKQNAHYIGIPVRADFTIVRNKWLDVYAGAGASADFCIAAFEDNGRITKDGVGFSLIGTGGIQFNITGNLGLFLDPTFSWNLPSNNRVLDTYKSDHPFMFSVSTGLRITIPHR